ncbi:hypothetical protein ACUIJQ_09835 [Levilactobacillus hammesii]|nr:hypothetical protein [Levilactobacillus hammesii]
MAALPFAKFGLERGGQDEESQSAVFPLALSRKIFVSKTPFTKQIAW